MATTLPFYIREEDPPAKREIVRAAMKLFSSRGLVGTSIRDIAAESGYTNPALYKHFAGKEELALELFETCHARVWAEWSAALAAAPTLEARLAAYVGHWLELVDQRPEVAAFLSDSARTLWPKASARIRRHTLIGLARSLAVEAGRRRRAGDIDPDVAAACLQGTLSEWTRMLQVGVVRGPALRWKDQLVALFTRMLA